MVASNERPRISVIGEEDPLLPPTSCPFSSLAKAEQQNKLHKISQGKDPPPVLTRQCKG